MKPNKMETLLLVLVVLFFIGRCYLWIHEGAGGSRKVGAPRPAARAQQQAAPAPAKP